MTKMKHYKSVENLKNLSNPQECMLFVEDWAKIPFLNYLNLHDIEGKKFNDVTWSEIPFSEIEIIRYCNHSMFIAYKEFLLPKIDNSDLDEIPCLIRKLLKVARMTPSDLTITNSQYKTVLHCLLERVEKKSLLPIVWKALNVSDQYKVDIFSEFIRNHQENRSAELLENIIKVALNDRFNIWNVCNKNHELYGFHCPVTEALFRGEDEKMNVLVKYGFELNSQRINTYDKCLISYPYHIYQWLRKQLVESTSSRKKIVLEILLLMVVIALSTQSKRSKMINCYFLLWEVITTPYVTETELEDEVQRLFLTRPQHSHFPCSESDFMRLCYTYGKYFLEDEGAFLQPRSLKHLCKCEIRKELQKSWTLPVGIYKLPLPENLQQYLDVSL